MIRDILPMESDSLVNLAESTGVFKPGEARMLLGETLQAFHQNTLGENHQMKAWVEQNSQEIRAWSYFAPSQHSEGVWDIWWIGVDPKFHGKRYGAKLLEAIESFIISQHGRLIVIETGSTSPLEKARNFYPKLGYKECGRIPNFYGKGDDKIIFSKNVKD